MAGRNFVFVPGPTNVPDRVMRSMGCKWKIIVRQNFLSC